MIGEEGEVQRVGERRQQRRCSRQQAGGVLAIAVELEGAKEAGEKTVIWQHHAAREGAGPSPDAGVGAGGGSLLSDGEERKQVG